MGINKLTQSDIVTLYLWHSNGTREYVKLRPKAGLVKSMGDTTPYSLDDFYMDPETAYKLQNFTYSHTAKDGIQVFCGHEPQQNSRTVKYAVRIMKAILSRNEST